MALTALSLGSLILISAVIYRPPSKKRKIRELQIETQIGLRSASRNQGRPDTD